MNGKIWIVLQSMKITVEFSDSELKEICRVTGESKKGSAIRKLVTTALMFKRLERFSQQFISGEWGVELTTYEAGQAANRQSDLQRDQSWKR